MAGNPDFSFLDDEAARIRERASRSAWPANDNATPSSSSRGTALDTKSPEPFSGFTSFLDLSDGSQDSTPSTFTRDGSSSALDRPASSWLDESPFSAPPATTQNSPGNLGTASPFGHNMSEPYSVPARPAVRKARTPRLPSLDLPVGRIALTIIAIAAFCLLCVAIYNFFVANGEKILNVVVWIIIAFAGLKMMTDQLFRRR